MNFNLGKIKNWSGSPSAALAAALTLAMALTILPSAWTFRLRDTAAICLRPGQRAVIADGDLGLERHRPIVARAASL